MTNSELQDWPATNDFQSAYPELYHDFCDALPAPDYSRRDGVLNLYAHVDFALLHESIREMIDFAQFPPGPTRPDIGPKMYNAFVRFPG